MPIRAHLREHADRCLRAAEIAASPEVANWLRKLANENRDLADQFDLLPELPDKANRGHKEPGLP